MMNTKVVATGLAIVLLGGGLAAGLGAATSGGGSSDTTSDTAKTDYNNIPGMAMGAPPQTVSMNCATDSCDLVFVPPSTETVQPLGLAVQLMKSDATRAVFSVAGKTVTVQPGRETKAQGATFTLTSPPGAVVNLHISKS